LYTTLSGVEHALPSPLVYPLTDNLRLIELLSETTGKIPQLARELLYREERHLADYMNEDFQRRGLAAGVWSDGLIEYYRRNDAFLFGGIAWNRNPAKLAMRQWVGEYLARSSDVPQRILCYGDGPGFDSLYLAQCGHDVTYFEVSECLVSFARQIFPAATKAVHVVTAEAEIEAGGYDVALCFDVLEHVPDPPALIAKMRRYLRPGGRFIVNAPFFFVSAAAPTHLRCNLHYSGSLSLYSRCGLRLLDGRAYWAPLVFGIVGPDSPPSAGFIRRTILRLSGIPFLLSRVWPGPLNRCCHRMMNNDPQWEKGLAP
jgi:SAM-dependent methyltransferase